MNIDKYQKRRCRESIERLVRKDGYKVSNLKDWRFQIVHDNGIWIYYASMYCPEKGDKVFAIQKVTDELHDIVV